MRKKKGISFLLVLSLLIALVVPAFAEAIRSVYRNAAQTAAMGQNGRREIQPYTIAAVGAELNDLLQAVRD